MKKERKHTHTTVQQWPGAYLLHRRRNNIIMQKNFCLIWYQCNWVVLVVSQKVRLCH